MSDSKQEGVVLTDDEKKDLEASRKVKENIQDGVKELDAMLEDRQLKLTIDPYSPFGRPAIMLSPR